MRESRMASLSALLVVGAISLPLLASTTSAVAASPRTTPPIGGQLAELKGSGTVAGDEFGDSVAISGTTAVVGAHFHAGGGQAYVFTETGGVWKQVAELKGSDTATGDFFGTSVAISGATAVIGAWGHAKAGAAYVFTETGSVWKQVAELKGSDTVAGDRFGYSVAVSGTIAVVGAYYDAGFAGRAYVFTETGGAWKKVAELKGSDTVAGNAFGYSVAISGTTAVVGAWEDDSLAGRAYVFTETGGAWKQVAELKGSDTVAGNAFGVSAAISGTTAVVGASEHAKAGAAYVFTKTGGAWKQVAELKGSDTVAGNAFGYSVAISRTTAVVGADAHADGAGRAYVFTETSGWKQVAELKGSDTVAGDYLGSSVAVSGTTVIVGSPAQTNDAGRAYVFEA